ncbi:hypothetical protein F53441_5323 [Fusarium austroafricanum]|uniref:Methyltransferase n=1 Tax=Fusarium austroafricanum TaxID=2364996 RepID=A0A8H4KLS7_9HYPO|nr:hypothetical protein F53441_5323 [Fusarium austroafricanum]
MSTVDADPILHPDEQLGGDADSSIGSVQFRAFAVTALANWSDLQHHLFLMTFDDKLGLAPPNNPDSKAKKVLDLGTGTGIWAIDYADEHPEADVTGVDLSPIQPDFVPPNLRFIIDDIDEDWEYDESFDYIHSRMMVFSIKNWEDYIRKIFKSLAPGGYIEIQEISGVLFSDDGTLTEDHALLKWCKLLGEAFSKLGSTSIEFDRIKAIMKEAGFVDIVDTRFKWPTNPWPRDKKYKELGSWNNHNASGALEALTMASFSRAHGWTREEVTMFLVDVRKDLNNPSIHAYNPICSIYAKKPDN